MYKQNNNNDNTFYTVSNLQTNCCLKQDFQNVGLANRTQIVNLWHQTPQG